ncbi:unnamed protein product (mitochondrion) [Plasmodiophora brassicae]|uniref:Uncharacterized protein n=1 Tax=Plasmodiophora brassicae TaxID=37360 RepID=A0A0G4IHT4_PLABS|nr:hypothetical protein PBRA_003586 [Plasmodiophora brassicae]SPQ98739.1 unnamed protein product [Plasmodiophora brassicae]
MRVRWTWLRSVEGWAGRRNDVLYGCRDAMGAGERARHLVVLFPGDLMASRDQDGDARAPSYEHAANDMLANDEDAGALVLVRPYDNSRGVAVYDNFVDVDEATGCALMQDPRGHATDHLFALLRNVHAQTGADVSRIVLSGFSRGGIVLNQMVAELAGRSMPHTLWNSVCGVRWLDPGNSPANGSFPLDPAAVDRFAGLCARQSVHVALAGTPFQWDNPSRPRTRQEMTTFVDLLRHRLPKHLLTVHYLHADAPPSIEKHFDVLAARLRPTAADPHA